ncbi:IclR family transcriptional regulator C-terminal domain-containing protein [Nonomuraea ferruginea]
MLLAQLTDDEVKALLPDPLPGITDHTITDLGKLTGELDQVRTRGWAYEREQGTSGVACVAVTVDYRIPATDAISCSMPSRPAARPDRAGHRSGDHTHPQAGCHSPARGHPVKGGADAARRRSVLPGDPVRSRRRGGRGDARPARRRRGNGGSGRGVHRVRDG